MKRRRGIEQSKPYQDYKRNTKERQVRNDPFSSDEGLMLLNNVLEFYENKDLKSIIDSSPKIEWMKIFLNMKVRPLPKIERLWNAMKQILCQLVEEESKKGGDETNRTEEGNEKTQGGGSGKKQIRKKSFSREQTIQVIDMIYHSHVGDLRDINWRALLPHFPGFCDPGLKDEFYYLYRSRVPKAKQKYFDEAMEYLYHRVKPVYNLKDKRQQQICKSVEAVFQMYKLQKSTNQKRKLSNFFTRNGGRDDDDEHALVGGREGERERDGEGERRKEVTFGRGGRRRKENLFISDAVCCVWLELMRRSDFQSKFDTEFLDVHENGKENERNEMRNENERNEKRNKNERNENKKINENEERNENERNEIENEGETEDEIEVVWASQNSFQITGASCPESDDESVGSSGSLEEGRGDYREREDEVTGIMEGREEESDDDYQEDEDEIEFLLMRRLVR